MEGVALAFGAECRSELTKDGERLCSLRESCGFGLTEERFGLPEVVALRGENGTGMEGGGRVAGLAEIGLGFAQAVFAEGDVGAVEVGLGRVGEHAAIWKTSSNSGEPGS